MEVLLGALRTAARRLRVLLIGHDDHDRFEVVYRCSDGTEFTSHFSRRPTLDDCTLRYGLFAVPVRYRRNHGHLGRWFWRRVR